jgi:hypothetical protein
LRIVKLQVHWVLRIFIFWCTFCFTHNEKFRLLSLPWSSLIDLFKNFLFRYNSNSSLSFLSLLSLLLRRGISIKSSE